MPSLLTTRARAIARCLTPLLVAVGGCTAPNDATVSVGYDAVGAYADPALFHGELRQAGSVRVIDGPTMAVRNKGTGYYSGSRDGLGLITGKPATVQVSVTVATNTTVDATVTWTPEPRFGYGVSAIVRAHRPVGFCFATVTALPLPPRGGTSGDTLFFVQSGVPDGAVC